MNGELKPVHCGCGGEAIVLKSGQFSQFRESYYVSCTHCTAGVGPYDTEAEAVTAWNRAMGWEDPKWWCNLCASYDKQRCYCNLHGIWTASDFGCKAFEPYCEDEEE